MKHSTTQQRELRNKKKKNTGKCKALSVSRKRNKQLIVTKILDLNSNKINVHKLREQSTISKVNVTYSNNERKGKKFDSYLKKTPKAPVRENINRHNNVSNKRVTVIRDSMVTFFKSENLSDKIYFTNIKTNPDFTTKDIADYIKSTIRRKPDIILVHTSTNDLINSVNTIKIRKEDSNNSIRNGW